MNEPKPVNVNGARYLDAEFNPVRMTHRQARQKALSLQRATRKNPWGKDAIGLVHDAGSHFNISVGFPMRKLNANS